MGSGGLPFGPKGGTPTGSEKKEVQISLVDRILCKECHWDGHVSQCKREENKIVKGLIILLCPNCDLPLAEEEESQFTLTEQNAVIMRKF